MADEHAPGPSPAYDPWRAPASGSSGEEGTTGQSSQRGQQPGGERQQGPPQGAPVRNADGSWTVEVHPRAGEAPAGSPAYPQPRRPLTAPKIGRASCRERV